MNFIFLGITKGETAGTWQQKTLRKSKKKNQEKNKKSNKKKQKGTTSNKKIIYNIY